MTKQDYDKLRDVIKKAVYPNGVYAITGLDTQSALLQMLGATETEGKEWVAETDNIKRTQGIDEQKISDITQRIDAHDGKIATNESGITANTADITNLKNDKQNKADAVGKKTAEGGEVFNLATSADIYGHAEGTATIAARKAHAEGNETKASGVTSHAEGTATNANGIASHAEGNESKSDGNYSHAEGFANSIGEYSHAEGFATKASNDASHAEGKSTTASGEASHAEGTSCRATNNDCHAEGNGTLADGTQCHAEGSSTTASVNSSHAEGASTKALADYAHAEGLRTSVSGTASHGEGRDCVVSASYSHAEGLFTRAIADYSCHAEGESTTARGTYSHAEGFKTESNGRASHVEGFSTNKVSDETVVKSNDGIIADWNTTKFSLAKGVASHVEGQECLALGNNSHAEGVQSIALGEYSHASGSTTIARGNDSCTLCRGTEAYNYGGVAMGVFNLPQKGNPSSFIATNNLLEIGNGSFSTRGNAFVVTGEGNVKADGTYTSPAGDYAEMFEWKDGNKKAEDRVGYIVAIDGEKIVKANGNEHIGIVSAKPSILGDNPMRWAKKFATDEWGRVILEDVEVKYTENEEIPSGERDAMVEAEFNARMAKAEPIAEEGLTEEGIAMAKEMQKEQIRMEAENAVPTTRAVEKTRTDTVQKLNPDYNPELDFIPRTDRSEWSAVGMMGKLLVRQDGTLKVGGKCSAKDGIATNDENGSIYVMKVINEAQALVLVK